MVRATRSAAGRKGRAGGAPPAYVRTPRQAANAELHIAIVRAAGRLTDAFAVLLKPVDLSLSQYNVLRILRGSGSDGATCGDIVERMIQKDPDVTRLGDRLERRGLVVRRRDAADRRIVRTQITDAGLELLASLDGPIDELHERHAGHLTDRQMADLRRLVERISP